MHPYDVMLIVSIATAVAFVAVIYVRKDLVLALSSILASVVGATVGSNLAFRYVPIHDQFAVIFGSLFGAVLLVVIVWFVRMPQDRE